MLAAMLSFTAEGKKQSLRIDEILRKSGYDVVRRHFGRGDTGSFAETAKRENEKGRLTDKEYVPSDIYSMRIQKGTVKPQGGSGRAQEETVTSQGGSGRTRDETAKSQGESVRPQEEPVKSCGGYVRPQDGSVRMLDEPEKSSASDFVSRMFHRADLLIFVGACGIAVRLIAPHVRDKRSDPAVLVVDELGRFVIPVLSGHLGGANRYARQLADGLGAVAVITTATDLEGRFAPDLFAEKYHLKIRSMEDAKAVAAAGLQRDVRILMDVPCEGELPPEKGAVCIYGVPNGEEKADFTKENRTSAIGGEEVCYSNEDRIDMANGDEPAPCVLVTNAKITGVFGHPQCVLVPRNLILGIGCRRGTGAEQIIAFVREVLEEKNLSAEAIGSFASIELKRDEPGIIGAAKAFGVPFVTYRADELNALPGEFTASEFVKRQTGTDNVCERSAAKAGEGRQGRFLLRKQAKDGMTLAVYETAVH